MRGLEQLPYERTWAWTLSGAQRCTPTKFVPSAEDGEEHSCWVILQWPEQVGGDGFDHGSDVLQTEFDDGGPDFGDGGNDFFDGDLEDVEAYDGDAYDGEAELSAARDRLDMLSDMEIDDLAEKTLLENVHRMDPTMVVYLDLLDEEDEEATEALKRRRGGQPGGTRRPRFNDMSRPDASTDNRQFPTARSVWWDYAHPEATPVVLEEFVATFKVHRRRFVLIEASTRAAAGPDTWRDDLAPGRIHGYKPKPLKILILACLYRLASGNTWASIAREAQISKSVLNAFASRWYPWFKDTFYEKYISYPQTPEQLEQVARVYARTGAVGACDSVDGVHSPHWKACPSGLVHLAKGKEKYPSLAHNVHVIHGSLWCTYIGPVQLGATNDKTMQQYDEFMEAMCANPLFTNAKCQLYNAEGVLVERCGMHSVCDNGYIQVETCIPPFKHCGGSLEGEWSEMYESIRKDIERFFGILKKRFRVLSNPIQVNQKKYDIDFRCCTVLQNMWVEDIGMREYGTKDEHWKSADLELYRSRAKGWQGDKVLSDAAPAQDGAATTSFTQRRKALVVDYVHRARKGEIFWIKQWYQPSNQEDAWGRYTTNDTPPFCYNCAEPGHWADACPHASG